MSSKLIFGIAAIMILNVLSAAADIGAEDVEAALADDLVHPYLYFSPAEKSAILARIENDPEAGDIYHRELAEANRLIHSPVEKEAPQRHTNARFEADYAYEAFLMRLAEASYRLAFVYQINGDRRYAEKAFEFADVLCDQPTWIHSVHEFPDIYDRVWPMGSKDDHAAFGYSQHADHYVFRMAAVYDWLYDALTKRQRDRIRGALLEKAILRVRGNYEYHWWAAAYRCNWCAVCNASLGVAAIALLTEDPNLVDVIAESYNRIGRTLDEIKSGGWQEGLGYLNYTIRTSLTFAETLKRATGGKLDLYQHPRFDDAVDTFLYCQFPPGKSVHFGDSGGGKTGSYGMFNTLMLERNNCQAAWLRKHLGFDSPAHFMDIVRPKSTISSSLPKSPSRLFSSVNWAIMRSDFSDTDSFCIAAKCGMNDDPHHGHLDCGHLSLYWRGCEFLSDNGSAGYDKAYFDEARWDYPLATTGGHNCVMVNGEAQEICKRKNTAWDMRYGGEIVEFRPGRDLDYILMDPTKAYPGNELHHWHRHIVLDKPDLAFILDEVSAAPDAEIEVRFHSAAQQECRDSFVLLDNNGDQMVFCALASDLFAVREGRHTVLMAQRNAKMREVPYFGVVSDKGLKNRLFAAIVTPVKSLEQAEQISASLNLALSGDAVTVECSIGGEQREYSFTRKGNHLSLAP